ncbi:hypothetical protein GOZ89_17050 [Agrobacterium vitis]|uniref:hypothetical protein n=1 Tax=Agrobacterium vitis TaxID=373 RepID=UPI0012E72AA5|nr:hypothetical protein [Agrobacterium vitis]MVA81133.1 hypothetical protein [Agrobacterium vitis]
MATVSEICQLLALEIPMPLNEVQKFARALINSGDLPKAVGRSIPETTMQDRAKLILAIAASERPKDCVKAMRDRYNAPHIWGEHGKAGDVFAEQLREISEGCVEGVQKWTYSDIEVSRTGDPRVKFRINEKMRRFEGFQNTEQPEFIGGTASADSIEEMTEAAKEFGTPGLPVSAFIPGKLLIVLAFGSKIAAENALIPIRKEAWRRKHEAENKIIENEHSEGRLAIRGNAADIRKYLSENGSDDE